MKKANILIIVVLVAIGAYYYYYTFKKPCSCNCANGGKCKCKKNLFLKAFDALNSTVNVKRKGCQSTVLKKDEKSIDITLQSVPLTGNPTTGVEELKSDSLPQADTALNDAQSKTNEEMIFAEQSLNIAKTSKTRLEASKKVDGLIAKSEKKLDEQVCLRKNLADDPRLSVSDVSQIDTNCDSEIRKITTQIKLLRHMKQEILDNNGYENVGYGIFVLKGVMQPESVHKVYNHLLDRSDNKKDWVVLCKKEDITNIGMVVPCENIIDLYWNEFIPTK